MKSKEFIFKYDPESSMERLFVDLQQAWEGKLKVVEPNIVRSNSIKALLKGLTEERLELFSVLAKEKPDDLQQLANFLHRDYQSVKKDAEILASWGIIKIQAEKPIALYEKITLEFPTYQEPVIANEKRREIHA